MTGTTRRTQGEHTCLRQRPSYSPGGRGGYRLHTNHPLTLSRQSCSRRYRYLSRHSRGVKIVCHRPPGLGNSALTL